MADDPYRSSRMSDVGSRPAAAGSNDPLAELARLIGQTDPFGEYGRESARTAGAQSGASSAAPQPGVAPAAGSFGHPAESQGAAAQAHPASHTYPPPPFEHGLEDPALAAYNDEITHDDYAPPPRRRTPIVAAGAVFAVAVIGVVGDFGYRTLFGEHGSSPPPVIKADPTPSKIVPPKKDTKLIQERLSSRPGTEKVVSREETPVDPAAMRADLQSPAAPQPAPTQAGAPLASGVIATEPKRIHTITIRPDMSTAPATPSAPSAPSVPSPPSAQASPPASANAAAAPPLPPSPPPAPRPHVAAAPANAPLSLNPNAAADRPAAPARTASVPNAAPATPNAVAHGSFAVQISARRSEAEARGDFQSLQAKFPAQLGGRTPLIRRVELGSKGTYYRAMVGPFESSDEAGRFCAALKAAGGSCFVQRI